MKKFLMISTLLASNVAFSAVFGIDYKFQEPLSYQNVTSSKVRNCSGEISKVKYIKVTKSSSFYELVEQDKEQSEVVVLKIENESSECTGVLFTANSANFAMGLHNSIGKQFEVFCVERTALKSIDALEICEFEIK